MHEGIYSAYNSVAESLLSAVLSLVANHPEAPIMVTGHSLGGALAIFAAVDIKLRVKG